MNGDPFAPVSGAGARRIANAKPKWVSVVPVPADAPSPPAAHPTVGEPSGRWTYTDAAGAVLGYVLRFEPKTFRPLTLWRNAASDKLEWRWESWPPKRPLYGLQRLAEKPGAAVVICEGGAAGLLIKPSRQPHPEIAGANRPMLAVIADSETRRRPSSRRWLAHP